MLYNTEVNMECVFCHIDPGQYILDNEYFFVIADKRPVTPGHLLVISKRHFADYFGIGAEEAIALSELVKAAKDYLAGLYAPEAYNLGMNCGAHAGQSVFHFHLHLIPRYAGDSKGRKQLRGLREYIREIL